MKASGGILVTGTIDGQNGNDGQNGSTPIACYRWYKEGESVTAPTDTSRDEPIVLNNNNAYPVDFWSKTAPNRPADGWHLYMSQSVKHIEQDGTITRNAWSTPVQISGATGSPGEDASDREWIYKLSPTTLSTLPSVSQNVDGYVPDGWSNHPLGIDSTNIYEYACYRTKPAGTGQRTWSAWKGITGGEANDAPILWSHWGRNGIDGDGVEYVFLRTKKEIAPVMDTTQTGYEASEFRPTITNQQAIEAEASQTTDDALGTSETWPYEWVAIRRMAEAGADGRRSWPKFQGRNINGTYDYKMSLWAKYGKDGESSFVCSLDTYSIAIETDRSNNIKNDVEFHIGLKAHYGQQDVLSACNISATTTDGDIDVHVRYPENASPYVEVKLYEGNGLDTTNDVSITITHSTYGSRTLVCKITRVTEGQSITGKTGPMCYIAGEFVRGYEYRQVLNADGSVKSTVAVEVDTGNNMTELWLLTAATNLVNGVYVSPKDEHQSVWEQGLNSYNLVRTRYLFADFAKLGSGVVSGDWLYSQYGKLVYYNGSAYQTITIDSTNCDTIYGTGVAYIHFDGSHPYNDTTGMESGDYRFFPNFAVDLLTGVVYMQAAYVSGTINATDGTIGAFEIGQNWLGNVVQDQNADMFTGCKITRSGQLIIGNDTLNYVLRVFGGIELDGRDKNVTIVTDGNSNTQTDIVLSGRIRLPRQMNFHNNGALPNAADDRVYADKYGVLRVNDTNVTNKENPFSSMNTEIGKKQPKVTVFTAFLNSDPYTFTLPADAPIGHQVFVRGTAHDVSVTVASPSTEAIVEAGSGNNTYQTVAIYTRSTMFVKMTSTYWVQFDCGL